MKEWRPSLDLECKNYMRTVRQGLKKGIIVRYVRKEVHVRPLEGFCFAPRT